MRFFRYFTVLFVVVLVVFAIALAAIYRDVRQQAIQELNARQMVHARQAAQGIEHHMAYIVNILELLARLPGVEAADDDGKAIMRDYQSRHAEEVMGVTRLDAGGRIVFTTPASAGAVGRDISYQAHVREILRTRTMVVSDIFMAVQGFRTVAVHVPVFRHGEFAGTLAFLLSFDRIAGSHIENIRVGSSGYAWVVSRQGFEISCPIPGHLGRNVYDTYRGFPEVAAMADRMLKGEEGVTSYHWNPAGDPRGKHVLKHAVFRPIRLGNTFWSIVVATPENEVLQGHVGVPLEVPARRHPRPARLFHASSPTSLSVRRSSSASRRSANPSSGRSRRARSRSGASSTNRPIPSCSCGTMNSSNATGPPWRCWATSRAQP